LAGPDANSLYFFDLVLGFGEARVTSKSKPSVGRATEVERYLFYDSSFGKKDGGTDFGFF
jgi:hypothetical protein